jgi:hypothetical protein
MIGLRKLVAGAAMFVLSYSAALAPDGQVGLRFISEAEAIIGRPLTPFSYAGVARRTTRRAVLATSSIAASEAAMEVAAVPAAGTLPLGTVVQQLPAGCTKTSSGGVEYYKCGSDYYRAAFQSNNLVYVTAQP